jgi:hypothetical protein
VQFPYIFPSAVNNVIKEIKTRIHSCPKHWRGSKRRNHSMENGLVLNIQTTLRKKKEKTLKTLLTFLVHFLWYNVTDTVSFPGSPAHSGGDI